MSCYSISQYKNVKVDVQIDDKAIKLYIYASVCGGGVVGKGEREGHGVVVPSW